MAEETKLHSDFTRGLWKENPVLIQVLGMCPTLAVSNSAINGLSMGLAVIFVLACASAVVSVIRKLVPSQVRIVTYAAIIASFVTVADRFLAAYFYDISKALGPYVPLIVVNCIILGRCEAFSSRHGVGRSMLDAVGMGAGFTWVLVLLGSIREIVGSGRILACSQFGFDGVPIFDEGFAWVIMLLPAGAFITLGFLIGLMNLVKGKRSQVG